MKQFLLLLLLLPLAAFSQHIQSDQSDNSGHSRRIATSRVELNGFSTSLAGVLFINECDTLVTMNLFFRAGKPTCTDEKTNVLLQLENGETVQAYNQGKYKELTATEPGFVVFELNKSNREKMMHYKVLHYTIRTSNAAVEVDLDDRQQKSFLKTISLLQLQAQTQAYLD